jgi:hypothetical protein
MDSAGNVEVPWKVEISQLDYQNDVKELQWAV